MIINVNDPESFEDRISRLIREELNGEVELHTSGCYTYGHVISPEFEGKTYEDRRNRLEEVVERLNKKERSRIGTFLAYTPREWASWS